MDVVHARRLRVACSHRERAACPGGGEHEWWVRLHAGRAAVCVCAGHDSLLCATIACASLGSGGAGRDSAWGSLCGVSRSDVPFRAGRQRRGSVDIVELSSVLGAGAERRDGKAGNGAA